MSVTDAPRLRLLLGGAEWAWLRARLRRLLAHGRELPRIITNASPTGEERQAANRLLARPGKVGPVRVRIVDLTRILREACIADDPGLRACLEELDGPIRDLRAEAAFVEQQWHTLYERARQRLGALTRDHETLDRLAREGTWRRLAAREPAQAEQWVEQLALLAGLLAERRDWLIAELAARATGDAHALDRGRALGVLALRIFSPREPGDGVLAWREVWRELGVRTDELSAPALCLNLERQDGEPRRLTTRAIVSPSWRWAQDAVMSGERRPLAVFVCENPTVVAAIADRLGSDSPPVVCVEGQPTTAALLLLERLRADGAWFYYHGDADWPGVAIANSIYSQFGFSPWFFDSAALAWAAHLPGPALAGDPIAAQWDERLQRALIARGRALHEEAVIDQLLAAPCMGASAATSPSGPVHARS